MVRLGWLVVVLGAVVVEVLAVVVVEVPAGLLARPDPAERLGPAELDPPEWSGPASLGRGSVVDVVVLVGRACTGAVVAVVVGRAT